MEYLEGNHKYKTTVYSMNLKLDGETFISVSKLYLEFFLNAASF